MKSLKPEFIQLEPKNRLYQMPQPILGLTGGIASGKSTVSKFLREEGFSIIDADYLVKAVYQKEEVIQEIAKAYPDSIQNNAIDFKVLRQAFFNDSNLQSKIEKIIYQRLPLAFTDEFKSQSSSAQDFIIYDVPLLFEKNLAPLVDLKVCVWCSPKTQIERLMKRDGIDEVLSKKILEKQWDINKKRDQSDLVIKNDGSLDELKTQFDSFLSSILL